MTTLYIAGPMTGHPENNYPAFHEAEDKLRKMGFDVLNPAHNTFLPDFKPTWADWMKVAIAQLIQADGIALLAGWENSRGARLENQIAEELGMERFILRKHPHYETPDFRAHNRAAIQEQIDNPL